MNDHQMELEHQIAKLQYLTRTLADQMAAMQGAPSTGAGRVAGGATWGQRPRGAPPPPPPPRRAQQQQQQQQNPGSQQNNQTAPQEQQGRSEDAASEDSSDAFPDWEAEEGRADSSDLGTGLYRLASDGFDEAEIGELMKPLREPPTTFYPLRHAGPMGPVSQV